MIAECVVDIAQAEPNRALARSIAMSAGASLREIIELGLMEQSIQERVDDYRERVRQRQRSDQEELKDKLRQYAQRASAQQNSEIWAQTGMSFGTTNTNASGFGAGLGAAAQAAREHLKKKRNKGIE